MARGFIEIMARAWRKKRLFRVGAVLSAIVLLMGVLGPFIAPYPLEGWGIVTDEALERGVQPPSLSHPFGTDILGRDMLSRILVGAYSALLQIFSVIALSLLIGFIAGVIAGYYRGFVEKIVSYMIDVFLAFPPVLIAMALATITGSHGIHVVVFSLVFAWWAWYARVAYLQTRVVREMDYVLIAERYGVSRAVIMFRHIIPNIMTPVLVQAITDIGSVLLEATAINFLGLGVPADYPDWGRLVEDGARYIRSYWWISFFPGLFILLAATGFTLVGDCLREELDPRLRRRWRLWF